MSPRPILALVGFLFAACSPNPISPAPQFDAAALAELDISLTVEPGEVAQHAPFEARLTVTNPTADTIRVVTGHGCLAVPSVVRDGVRIPFQGSWWGCTAAITTHTFAPGETRTRTWNMAAELYAQEQGETEGAPAPKGTYTVEARFDTSSESTPGQGPTVATTLVVR
jgi:hypothetical protein